jgi:hypothetical protein
MKLLKPQSMKEYGKRLMRNQNKVSQGALYFERSVTTATKDNWRRKDRVKKPHRH